MATWCNHRFVVLSGSWRDMDLLCASATMGLLYLLVVGAIKTEANGLVQWTIMVQSVGLILQWTVAACWW